MKGMEHHYTQRAVKSSSISSRNRLNSCSVIFQFSSDVNLIVELVGGDK